MHNETSNLKYSRNKFLELAKLPNANFWPYVFEKITGKSPCMISGLDPSWLPHRSNCPTLNGELEFLINEVPRRWQNLLDGIFVGRSFSGHVNAMAHTNGKARVVEYGLQNTFAIYNYATVLHQLNMSSVMLREKIRKHEIPSEKELIELNESLENMMQTITGDKNDAKDEKKLATLAHNFNGQIPEKNEGTIWRTIAVTEKWIMCHEIAHHLLGHTVKNKNRVNKEVNDFINSIELDFDLTRYNTSQIKELNADKLACLLTAGIYPGSLDPDANRIRQAITGGYLALVVPGHINESWVEAQINNSYKEAETHPASEPRIEHLHEICKSLVAMTGDRARGFADNTTGNLLIDMQMFAEYAMASDLYETGNSLVKKLNIVEFVFEEIQRKLNITF